MFRFAIAIACIVSLCAPRAWSDETAEAAKLVEQASARFEEALQAVRETGDKRAKADSLERVIDSLHRAFEAYQDAGKSSEAADCRLLAARASLLKGDAQRGQSLYADAEKLGRQSGNKPTVVRALLGQCLCQRVYIKNLERADANATEALRVALAVADLSLQFEAMTSMSEVDVAQGELASGWNWIEQAFRLAPRIKEKDEALLYGYLARSDVCFRLADRPVTGPGSDHGEQLAQSAVMDADAAHKIATRRGWKFLAQQTQQIAKTARLRQEMLHSQRDLQKILRDTGKIRAFSPVAAGDVVVTQKFMLDDAVLPAWFVDTVKQLRSRGIDDATAAYLEGAASSVAGKRAEALASYLRAVELLEKEYVSIADYENRKARITPAIGFHYYYWPMLYLLDDNDMPRAFSLMEASRSRLLMDLMTTGQQIDLENPSQQRLYSELRRLRAEIADLRQRSAQTLRLTGESAETGKQSAQIAQLEAEHGALLDRIRREAPELLEIAVAGTLPLAEVEQWTKDERFDLLEYVVFGDQLVAWHIGPSGVHVRSIFLPRDLLLEKIDSLNQTLVDPHVRFDTTLAKQFYLFLIQPLIEFVTTDHLVIVPHDELYYVSFQVLQDPSDGKFLADKFRISYAPSTRVLKELAQVASLEGAAALAVAAPSVLKSQEEAETVARILPKSRIILPNEATPTLVQRLSSAYQVLHLSAHGEFSRHDPMLSFLELKKQQDDEGKLTAGAMAALPLANVRLVVLSACETGKVSESAAGEMVGMPRALILAGADSVLLTRWKVDPEGTQHWMAHFYSAAAHGPLPEAARKASAALKADPRFSHPYYWGPFMLVGR